MTDTTDKASGALRQAMNRSASVARLLRQKLCNHQFAIDDLKAVNINSDGNDRVVWPCDKCGKVFKAHCGLFISPEHGPIFRRGSTKGLTP